MPYIIEAQRSADQQRQARLQNIARHIRWLVEQIVLCSSLINSGKAQYNFLASIVYDVQGIALVFPWFPPYSFKTTVHETEPKCTTFFVLRLQ